MRSLILSLATALVAAAADPFANLDSFIQEQATHYNMTISYGFFNADRKVQLQAGAGATPENVFPMGSITKSWTAVGIMQLAEQGKLSLDDKVAKHVDPILQADNGTTIEQLFAGHAEINNVTILDLLHMAAGLNDYDNTAYEAETIAHPDHDVSPYELLAELDKSFLYPPGQGGAYTTVGFDILGLVFAHHFKAPSGATGPLWKRLDQISVLPAPLRASLNATLFPHGGLCSSFADKGMVHQFATLWSQKSLFHPIPSILGWHDFFYDSCLNSWSGGNIAARPSDVAEFYYSLFQPGTPRGLVSEASLAKMLEFQPLTTGWSTGLPYGIGLMPLATYKLKTGNPYPNMTTTLAIGHGGMDWGSGAPLAGYDPVEKFGITIALDGDMGRNCSISGPGGDVSANIYASECVACLAYDKTHAALGTGISVDCNGCWDGDGSDLSTAEPARKFQTSKSNNVGGIGVKCKLD